LRDLPGSPPGRATRTASSNLSSCVLPCLCAGVSPTESRRPLPSQARCSLVEKPPCCGPRPRRGGSRTPFFVRRARFAPGARRVLVGTDDHRVSSTVTSHPTSPTASFFSLRTGNKRSQVPSRRQRTKPDKAVVADLPGTLPLREVAPGRAGAQLPKDAVNDSAVLAPLASALTVLGQERLDLLPGSVGDLSSSDRGVSSHSCDLL
jgi:hypothetical protein